jgi:hypothetical protein
MVQFHPKQPNFEPPPLALPGSSCSGGSGRPARLNFWEVYVNVIRSYRRASEGNHWSKIATALLSCRFCSYCRAPKGDRWSKTAVVLPCRAPNDRSPMRFCRATFAARGPRFKGRRQSHQDPDQDCPSRHKLCLCFGRISFYSQSIGFYSKLNFGRIRI